MAFLTDRKRAEGMGSAGTGTAHHWFMIVTSVALVGLVPLFIFTFGSALGRPHDEVIAYYSRPFPAIIAILMLLVGFVHFKAGVQTMIEDYVGGFARRALIIAMICTSYTAATIGIFAVLRIAL